MRPKVLSGTRDLRGLQPVKEGSSRKFRCSCGGMAHPQPDGKGGTTLFCPLCKMSYKSVSMD